MVKRAGGGHGGDFGGLGGVTNDAPGVCGTGLTRPVTGPAAFSTTRGPALCDHGQLAGADVANVDSVETGPGTPDDVSRVVALIAG